jgi:hypothetical protein
MELKAHAGQIVLAVCWLNTCRWNLVGKRFECQVSHAQPVGQCGAWLSRALGNKSGDT